MPLVKLLKTGSAKVQEEAASALSALTAEVEHQKLLLAAGCVPPLVAMLKGASAAGQGFAAQTLANAATSSDGQNLIAKAGAVPLLLVLLGVGKAQVPAARALARLVHCNAPIQDEMTLAGGVTPLLALLNGRNTDAQVAPPRWLPRIATHHRDVHVHVDANATTSPDMYMRMSVCVCIRR